MIDRWVLVTGGAARLGREICLAFARAGWNVICHYRSSHADAVNTCEEGRQFGVLAVALQANLEDSAHQERLFQVACETAGTNLLAIVNNASSFEPDDGLHLDTDAFERQLRLNLLVPLSFGSLMARQPWPGTSPTRALIHVLDQKVFNLNPDYFSYTVSKLALERAVALQAQALAPRIRVVGVAPGLIYVSGPQSQSNFDKARCANLMRKPTDPIDVAKTCVFVAETESINGISICVDMGQHLVPLERDIMFVLDALTKDQT